MWKEKKSFFLELSSFAIRDGSFVYKPMILEAEPAASMIPIHVPCGLAPSVFENSVWIKVTPTG